MIENYVHWNEDIGEWQLVSIPFILHEIMEWSWCWLLWEEGGAGWIRSELGGPFVAMR